MIRTLPPRSRVKFRSNAGNRQCLDMRRFLALRRKPAEIKRAAPRWRARQPHRYGMGST
jgi:hypothetical protein